MRFLPFACLCFLLFSCNAETTGGQANGQEDSSPSTAGTNPANENAASTPVELPSIVLGDQTWASENLAVTHFRNGDPIPHVTDTLEWEKAGKEGRPAWSYFRNDEANGNAWGILYNFHAVNSDKGLAPQGWHLPTRAEFDILSTTLGGKDIAAHPMKAFEAWDEDKHAEPSGFAALPARGRFDDGEFLDFPDITYWWTSEGRAHSTSAYYLAICLEDAAATTSSLHKGYGFSVRLVKD